MIFLDKCFFWKNSTNFWHPKLTLKVRFWHFLMNLIHRRIFWKMFPLNMLILDQKSCFLGPTIFKIPQPNWYYWVYVQFNELIRPLLILWLFWQPLETFISITLSKATSLKYGFRKKSLRHYEPLTSWTLFSTI